MGTVLALYWFWKQRAKMTVGRKRSNHKYPVKRNENIELPSSRKALTEPRGYRQVPQHHSQPFCIKNWQKWDKTEIFPKKQKSGVTLEGWIQRWPWSHAITGWVPDKITEFLGWGEQMHQISCSWQQSEAQRVASSLYFSLSAASEHQGSKPFPPP